MCSAMIEGAAGEVFDGLTAEMSPETLQEQMLIQAVKEEMLRRPPVPSLGFGRPNRMQEARVLATQDVRRLFRACRLRGLALVVLDRETLEEHVEKAVAKALSGSHVCGTRAAG